MGHDSVLDTIQLLLRPIYGQSWAAPTIAVAMVLGALAIWMQAMARTRPFIKAANARISVLEKALGSDRDVVAERTAFAENYAEIGEAMNTGGPAEEPLIQAWRDFQEQIIDETSSPIRNTGRPDVCFRRAAPKQTAVVFWSNIFVGIGLVLTFLGLIYALAVAAKGMQASGSDVAQTQAPLIALLTAAAAKFFTSVGGLSGSLLLRFGEHNLTKGVVARTNRICSLLGRGLLYVPPQKLAAEQLDELKMHTRELKSFNTDLAIQIGERMGAQFSATMAPVAQSLATLNAGMVSMGEGLREGLKGGAADAVSAAASGELRALGQTLNALREQLESLSSHVGNSGEVAARQIRAAGSDFREAAENIRAAFNELAAQVDGLGPRMIEQSEVATRAQSESFARIIERFEAAQGRSAAVIIDAVAAFEGAGRRAADDLQENLSAALTRGVAESQATFRHAVEESGQGLRSATSDLGQSLQTAVGQAVRAGELLQAAGDGAVRAADTMSSLTDRARDASALLGDVSKQLSAAASPVAQSAQAITLATDRMAKTIDANRDANADALRQVMAMADGMRETHAAAAQAWHDYRARFEGVDKALEGVTQKLAESLGDSISQFREFAHKLDGELAAAVSKLAGSLDTIEDYAGALDDYVETHARRLEAAE